MGRGIYYGVKIENIYLSTASEINGVEREYCTNLLDMHNPITTLNTIRGTTESFD